MNYQSRIHLGRYYAMKDDRAIGALSVTHIRAYVYPLYTPAGVAVLQEYPPDHCHQQGIMVGQDLLGGHNFWAMLHRGVPLNVQVVESQTEVETSPDEYGVTFVIRLIWRTMGGQNVIKEHRRVRFESWPDFSFTEITSTWEAAFGSIVCEQTKEGRAPRP